MSNFCEDAEDFLSRTRIFRRPCRHRTITVDASLNYKLLGSQSNEKLVGMRLVRTNKAPVDWKYLEKYLKSVSIASDGDQEIMFSMLYLDEQLFGSPKSSFIDLLRWMNQEPIYLEAAYAYKRLPLLNPTPWAEEINIDMLEGYHVEFDVIEINEQNSKPGHESYVYCPQTFSVSSNASLVTLTPMFDGGVHELWVSVNEIAKEIQIKVNNKVYWKSNNLEPYRCVYTTMNGKPAHLYRIPLIPEKPDRVIPVYPYWNGMACTIFNMSTHKLFQVSVDFEEEGLHDIELRVNSLNSIRMMEGLSGYALQVNSHYKAIPQETNFVYYNNPNPYLFCGAKNPSPIEPEA